MRQKSTFHQNVNIILALGNQIVDAVYKLINKNKIK